MVEAKYIKQIFAKETLRKGVAYDLSTLWYYLDEVTREKTQVKGPFPRKTIKKLLDEGRYLFKDGFAWHPSLGHKWMPIEKIFEIISPPPSLSHQALQEACMRKLQMQSQPCPHLKGHLDLNTKPSSMKKWVVILGKQIAIYPNNLSSAAETSICIEDIVEIILLQNEKGLGLRIEAEGGVSYVFNANKVAEIIEWYHALCCCRHLVLSLGNEILFQDIDMSELHVCNVRSSDEFIGEKLHEGTLKKQGLKWKVTRTRWFILRTHALFYYLEKSDKKFKKFFKLNANTVVDWQGEYKLSNHISLINPDRTLHIWADSTYEKEVWVEKLSAAIQNLKKSESDSLSPAW